MRWLVVLALFGACYSPRGTPCEPCNGIEECPGGLACVSGVCQERIGACSAPDDSGPEPLACYGVDQPPFAEVCPPMGPIDSARTLAQTIDTDLVGGDHCSYMAAASSPTLCVIIADTITSTIRTRVVGANPLVLLGRDAVTIEALGYLDLAGSYNDGELTRTAAAANVAACAAQTGMTGGTTPGGGAPGGSFAAFGGGGGAAQGGAVSASPSGPPGNALALRGGCRGGDGGSGGAGQGGQGGNSGGAILLMSRKITVRGAINASGGGARGARDATGGGGGGTGGVIALWAVGPIALEPSGAIFALGGGGGTGGGPGVAGIEGKDPTQPISTDTGTTGTAGRGSGGAGGRADRATGLTGGTGTGGGGGGGGGGSVGFIKIVPLMAATPQIAPPSS